MQLTTGRALTCLAFAVLLAAAGCERVGTRVSGEGVRVVTARGNLAEGEQATIELFESAAPSVVQVVSRAPSFTGAEGDVGSGTGFIWDEAGHIVTNNHVVASPEIAVRMPNGDIVRAVVVGRAPQYDLAVLRLAQPPNAPPLAIGSSGDLRVGQSVFAIGNPFGLDQSLTSGIVSALQRRLPTPDGREIADVIQTDAAINPGNSGGPLLDSAGRVIGVTTAIYSPSGANAGVGFAVPIDTVARVAPQLIQSGRAPTPGIGILAANEAMSAKLGAEGVLVWRAIPGGAAARAGLRGSDPDNDVMGDVIIEANGRPVQRLADLTDQLEHLGVGESVALTVRRGNENVQISVPIEDIGER